MSLRAIYFSVQDVGKHVKKSKKRFIWKFQVSGQENVLEMFVSYLSGKKQIILNGRSLYEAQKMTSSFQFPFQVENNQCIIVQHGEQFELRINNQVFSHLYNQERMKREFQFEEEGATQKKNDYDGTYGTKDDYGTSCGGGFYKGESSYKPKEDFGYQQRNDQQSYQSKSYSSSRPKGGWEDVKKAQDSVRRDAPKKSATNDDGFGFDDFKSNSQSKNNDPFESFDNKYSGDSRSSKPKTSSKQTNDFDSFEARQAAAFEQFETAKQQQQSGFASFDQFGGFDEKPKAQPSKSTNANDLLGLDFGGSNENQQTNQNTGFDFFGSGETQINTNTSNQGFEGLGIQPFMNQSQGQKLQENTNDLMGLEFGSPNHAATNTNNIASNTQVDFTKQNQTITNVRGNTINDAQAQKKKDLWDTDLVSLNPTEVNTNKNQSDSNYMGGSNIGYGSHMGNMNMNMNMGMNNNTSYGSFGTNQNFGGFAMTQSVNVQGYGGNMGMSDMNVNQGFNQNGGFGMNYQQTNVGTTTVSDIQTPFDF